jgi:hypothetical protein
MTPPTTAASPTIAQSPRAGRGEDHRLDLVVGDVDGGRGESALQGGDLGAGLHPQLGVEVGQRFVHQEHLGLPDDRSAHCHALALASGEGLGSAVEVLLEAEDLRCRGSRQRRPFSRVVARDPTHASTR